MVGALGAEVDRLETEIQQVMPSIRHIDLVGIYLSTPVLMTEGASGRGQKRVCCIVLLKVIHVHILFKLVSASIEMHCRRRIEADTTSERSTRASTVCHLTH